MPELCEPENKYCKNQKFSRVFYFANFAPARFGENKNHHEITLSFTNLVGKSCLSREVLAHKICLLTLFAKINKPFGSSLEAFQIIILKHVNNAYMYLFDFT